MNKGNSLASAVFINFEHLLVLIKKISPNIQGEHFNEY